MKSGTTYIVALATLIVVSIWFATSIRDMGGRPLAIVWGYDPQLYDPHATADPIAYEIWRHMCEPLFYEDAQGVVRGLLAEDLTITGPSRDLHSGMYGGIAMNPIRVLTKILGGLHDETGRVTVPGFYDGVPELPDQIRAQWQGLNFDHGTYLGDVGLNAPAGEQDRTPLEQIWSRPTCDINGIWGGYTGDGFKTVIPSEASAKVSFRLVGQQDPEAIRASFRAMLEGALPKGFTVDYRTDKGAGASQMDIADPTFEKARQALSDEWPRPAAYVGCGGSIPIAGYFQDILGLESILIGFGRDDDQIHSPNEKYDLESFHKGTRSWARILDALSPG